MQAWVSCSEVWSTACDPDALGAAECGEHRKHISTDSTRPCFVHTTKNISSADHVFLADEGTPTHEQHRNQQSIKAPEDRPKQNKKHLEATTYGRVNPTNENRQQAVKHPNMDQTREKRISKQQHMAASTR